MWGRSVLEKEIGFLLEGHRERTSSSRHLVGRICVCGMGLPCEGSAQGGCPLSTLKDFQNLAGPGPLQCDLGLKLHLNLEGIPALSRRLDRVTFTSCFQPKFFGDGYDSVLDLPHGI